jgi:Arc/MetJ-type ribon-helix-helix transcriptional regulator
MTIHLPPHIESSIEAAVYNGRFKSVDDAMTRAATLLLQEIDQEQATPAAASDADTAQPRKPIWEVFQEISASVPDEVWDALPTDLSEQHDHYIYGTPKRPPA